MKDNEFVIEVYDAKRQINLAKVRIATRDFVTGDYTYRTAFARRQEISDACMDRYYRDIADEGTEGQA
jgi:hypothetical protein